MNTGVGNASWWSLKKQDIRNGALFRLQHLTLSINPQIVQQEAPGGYHLSAGTNDKVPLKPEIDCYKLLVNSIAGWS